MYIIVMEIVFQVCFQGDLKATRGDSKGEGHDGERKEVAS